jgi:Fe-S cluster biogenesis protein NfuA
MIYNIISPSLLGEGSGSGKKKKKYINKLIIKEMAELKSIKDRVMKALERVRPYLQSDGGDIDLIDVTDDMTVKVKLTGACHGCPYSMQTLKAGVEQAIMKEVPEIKRVISA